MHTCIYMCTYTYIKIKAIRDILVTVAICDQHGTTRTLGQARRPLVHGNAHWCKLAKPEVNSRNGGKPLKEGKAPSTRTRNIMK